MILQKKGIQKFIYDRSLDQEIVHKYEDLVPERNYRESVSIHANQESDNGLLINNNKFELWYYEILIVGKLWVKNVQNVLKEHPSIQKD
jgi:hypothetical protein